MTTPIVQPVSGMQQSIGQKIFRGVVALGMRHILVQGLNVLGGVFLARLLTPGQFGLYAIITFLLVFLNTFSGTGMAANLIRQSEEPNTADYRAIFAFQTLVVLVLVVTLWIASPWIAQAYHLPTDDAWLFRLIALAVLASSFMVIPQVRLERRLDFGKLAGVEVAQAVVFNFVAVTLAWIGFNGFAFALALLLRYVVGAALVNWVEPWPLAWKWDWARTKTHLQFGFYFQGAQLISVFKDSVNPIFIGLLLGSADVGYNNWASMVAVYPVMALMALQRLYMPVFAQVQTDKEHLVKLVEQVIWATNAITAPLALLTLIFIEPITQMVFGEKWLVALPLFYLFWAANLVVPTITPLIGLLNALGQSRLTVIISLLWMLSTWFLSVPLILLYGVLGFAIANVGVQLTNFIVIKIVKQQIPFHMFRTIGPVWIIAFITFGFLYIIDRAWPVQNMVTMALYSVAGFGMYLIGLIMFYPVKSRSFMALARGKA